MRSIGLLVVLLDVQTLAARDHHLFNPVPREQLRELSTDRPNATESPYTVDAGHLQIEIEPVALTLDRGAGADTTTVSWFTTFLRLGVLPFADVQLGIEPYSRIVVEDGDEELVSDGRGAITVRMKFNLWGNDSGPTAFCIVPYVVQVDGGVDIGLNQGFAGELPAGFGYGFMLEEDLVRIDDDGTRGLELVASAVLGRELVEPLAGFIELAWKVATYDSERSALAFNAGATIAVLADLQLDAGTRIGLAGPIADLEFYLGVSARL